LETSGIISSRKNLSDAFNAPFKKGKKANNYIKGVGYFSFSPFYSGTDEEIF